MLLEFALEKEGNAERKAEIQAQKDEMLVLWRRIPFTIDLGDVKRAREESSIVGDGGGGSGEKEKKKENAESTTVCDSHERVVMRYRKMQNYKS